MNTQKISAKLIKLRGNLSREKVCSDVGISFSALQSYETGVRIPKYEIKVKLAKYYGVTVQSIFFD